MSRSGLWPIVSAVLCVLCMVLLYRASPRTSMGMFIDLSKGVSSLSHQSMDREHLLAECHPSTQGMRAHGYDPESLLLPAPKKISSQVESSSPSLVMLGKAFNIFSRIFEDEEDRRDIVVARELIRDMLHRFCLRSTRPTSIPEDDNYGSIGRITSVEVEISRR